MKLMYFDDYKLGVVNGDAVVDVSSVVRDIAHTGPHDLINGVIGRFAEYRPRLEEAKARGKGVPLADVKIRPPLPRPVNIDCMAVNYMEDGTRSEPAPINAFHKSPNAVIGPEDTMVLPDVPASIFEGEAEVAVVIGKRAKDVKSADAMSYVFGYANFVDGSARGLPPPGNVFYQMKSRDTFAPLGPYIVTADEIRDPHQLQVRLWVNGVLKQNFNTRRHGPQNSALHRVGQLDSYARARRRAGDRHQSPRLELLSGRRRGRARERWAWAAAFPCARRAQAHMGARDAARHGEQGRKRGDHAATDREICRRAIVIARLMRSNWH
jgi:2-keto-4-pentenoate hydratase/2-oxohepta-3-ene-1,7-dioic acid hydratase in catechol pathway